MQVDNLEATIMSDERTENKKREHLRGEKHGVYFTRREDLIWPCWRREREGDISKSSVHRCMYPRLRNMTSSKTTTALNRWLHGNASIKCHLCSGLCTEMAAAWVLITQKLMRWKRLDKERWRPQVFHTKALQHKKTCPTLVIPSVVLVYTSMQN